MQKKMKFVILFTENISKSNFKHTDLYLVTVVPSIQVSKSWQSIKASAGREVKRVARETRDAMVLLRHTAKHGEQQVPW